MRTRVITLFSILILAALLAACDAPAIGTQSTATPAAAANDTGGPGAGRTPGAGGPGGGQRNGTPGAGFPGGGQRNGTPGAGFPGGRATAQAEASATAQAGGAAQPTATSAAPAQAGVVPTAVPAPVIVIPTAISSLPLPNGPTPLPVQLTSVAPVSQPPATRAAPTTVPARSLQDLKGKIVFFSDRGGGYSQLYMMNSDGSNPQLCNCSDALQAMVATETLSPDKQQFLFVKTVGAVRAGDTQIWRHNNANNTDEPVTGGPPGFPTVDYDPVWSPDSRHVAWVTEKDKFDEIYLHDTIENSDVRLTQSNGEWYKHPSFSPDGSHIVFWSNLGNLNYKQIWVMSLDGSGKVNLSNNNFNDWDPIWVK